MHPIFSFALILEAARHVDPNRSPFDLDFATTARWDGDLLVEEYVSWDSALQAQQAGLA